MDLKRCIKCQRLKPLSEFSKGKRHKDGKYPYCKECASKWRYENKDRKIDLWKKYYPKNKEQIAERMIKYRQDNQEKYLKYGKQYRKDNKENIATYQEKYYTENKGLKKLYQQEHKKELNEYFKKYNRKRRKIDLKFNLNCRMTTAINISLKGNKDGRHWEIFVNYTLNDLIKHLKKTLSKNYTWQDFLKGRLHIDHIIPIKVFNFTIPEHIDFKRCWALENLQLLPARENIIKSNKLFKPFQPALALQEK